MKQLFLFVVLIGFSFSGFGQKSISHFKSKESALNEQYCTGLFSSAHGQYFDLLDDPLTNSATAYLNVLDWLQGRVAGLQVYTTRDYLRIPYIRNQRAGIFINEMRVDYDFLNMLPVTDIAMIKIIKEPFYGGFNGPGGAIVIYTIRGEEEEED